jgi:hypothetical protein
MYTAPDVSRQRTRDRVADRLLMNRSPRHFNYASSSAFFSRAWAKKSRAVPLPMFLMLYELPAYDWSERVQEGTPIKSAVTRHNM